MQTMNIKAQSRKADVKNVFRKSKREGYIPAVIYNKKENIPIRIPRIEFFKLFNRAQANTIFNIDVEGTLRHTFIKDYQESLTKSRELMHVDFFMFEENQKIKINVPLRIKGVAAGIVLGGVLETFATEVTVFSLPKNVPEIFELDVSPLQIGEHLNISDLPTSEDMEILDSPDRILVSVISAAKEETPEEEAGEGGGVAATAADGEAPAEGNTPQEG